MITVHGSSLQALSAYSHHSDVLHGNEGKGYPTDVQHGTIFDRKTHPDRDQCGVDDQNKHHRNHGGTSLLGLVCDNKDARVEPTLEALFFSLISEQLFWQHTVSIVLDP